MILLIKIIFILNEGDNLQFEEKKINYIKNDLKNRFSSKRYLHTEGVVDIAVKLAKKNGVKVEKAAIAALLHDYAKPLSQKKLIKYARNSNINIDETEFEIPELLHAPVGAFLAKNKYDIIDKDIFKAIRYHTIGKPGINNLGLIIFAADFIEPNRNFPGVKDLREVADKKTLSELTVAVCDQSIRYNLDLRKNIHPNTLLLRNEHLGGK